MFLEFFLLIEFWNKISLKFYRYFWDLMTYLKNKTDLGKIIISIPQSIFIVILFLI